MMTRRLFVATGALLSLPLLGLRRALGGEPAGQRPSDPVRCKRPAGAFPEVPEPHVTDDMIVTLSAIMNDEVAFVGRSVNFSLNAFPRQRNRSEVVVPLGPSIDTSNIGNLPVGNIPLDGLVEGSFDSNYFRLMIPELHVPLVAGEEKRVHPFFEMQIYRTQRLAQVVLTLPSGINLNLTKLVRALPGQQAIYPGKGWVFQNFVVEAHAVRGSVNCR